MSESSKSQVKKKCGVCGAYLSKGNWKKHWENQHPKSQITEIAHDKEPSEPNFKFKTGKFTQKNDGYVSKRTHRGMPQRNCVTEQYNNASSLMI